MTASVTLSTGNVWQLLALQAAFPQVTFNTPLQETDINYFRYHYYDSSTRNLLNFQFEQYESDEGYVRQLRQVLRALQGGAGGSNGVNNGDDLPTKIAEAIANT